MSKAQLINKLKRMYIHGYLAREMFLIGCSGETYYTYMDSIIKTLSKNDIKIMRRSLYNARQQYEKLTAPLMEKNYKKLSPKGYKKEKRLQHRIKILLKRLALHRS